MKLNPRINHQKKYLLCFLGLLICYVFTVQIVAATSLDVQVVDVYDNPVKNLPIILRQEDSDIELPIETDIDGKCTFSSLENKVYVLILQGFEHDYYRVEAPIEITDEDNFYKLVVREKAGLTIQIRYEDGSPAENIRVTLEGDSGTYEELLKAGQRSDYDGRITYPFGVPEDRYTVIIKNTGGKEIARHTESITSDLANHLTYNIEKTSPIPSYPLLSVVGGLGYWLINRRRAQCQA
jgi:hypothetical protein